MERIRIILLLVVAVWFYRGLTFASLVDMKDYLIALGVAMIILPWVEYHLDR